MPERIVDVLEAVEIDEQHRDALPRAARIVEHDAEAPREQRAVRQFGQHVVLGEELDARLALLAICDVDQRADVMRDVAALVAHRADHQPRRIVAALAAAHVRFTVPRARTVDERRKVPDRLFARMDTDDESRRLAGDVVGVIAGRAIERRVGRQQAALMVENQNRLRRCLEDLAPQFEPLLHQLDLVDRREGGQHGVVPLEGQAPRGQHRPRRLRGGFPAHLEFVDLVAVGQLLEKPRAHRGVEGESPRIDCATVQPEERRPVRVQHFVAGNRCHHHRHRRRFDERVLRLGRARRGGEFLLHISFAVELLEHFVEARHELADFILTVPARALRMVSRAAHGIHHACQLAQRTRDLLRDEIHHAEDAAQQEQRGAEMQPHPRKQPPHARMQQAVELRAGIAPRLLHTGDQRLLRGVDRVQLRWVGATAVDHRARGAAILLDRIAHAPDRLRQRHVERMIGGTRFAEVGLQALQHRVELSFQHEIAGAHFIVRRRHARLAVQLPADAVDGVEQRRIAQDRQRHRVVAVEVRIENQVRLVADACDEFAACFECFADRGRRRILLTRELFERDAHVAVERRALHVRAVARFGIGETVDGLQQRGRRRTLSRTRQRDVDQRIAHRSDIRIADDLLVRKIDGDIFFVDQDAADVDHRAQIEQIDQQQLSAHAQTREHAEEKASLHRHQGTRIAAVHAGGKTAQLYRVSAFRAFT